jgi:hypothetical protein
MLASTTLPAASSIIQSKAGCPGPGAGALGTSVSLSSMPSSVRFAVSMNNSTV